MTDDERLALLEDVADKARFYIEKVIDFEVREAEEGRPGAVSPRVAFAYKDLLLALERVDQVPEQIIALR